MPTKNAGKVLAGRKAARQRHFSHALAHIGTEYLGGELDAAKIQIVRWRHVGELFGILEELRYSQTAPFGHPRDRPLQRQMFRVSAQIGPE